MEEIKAKLLRIVEAELACSAHDLEHVKRVCHLCGKLARSCPGLDMEVLETAALLHDIARVKEDHDPSGATDHAKLGAEMAASILAGIGFPGIKIEAVAHCIRSHRYRSDSPPQSGEAKVLFDADKLDVLGAVGLARSYMLAGEYREKLYAPVALEEYIRENLTGGVPGGRVKDITKHAANLEYELKFKMLPARLHTPEARALAEERLEYMNAFFQRLQREIRGED
jgi:uncharacterized protein